MRKFASLSFIWLSLLTIGCNRQNSLPSSIAAPATAASDTDVYFADRYGKIRLIRADGSENTILNFNSEMARVAKTSASDEFAVESLIAESNGQIYGLAYQESGGETGQRYLFAASGNQLSWQKAVSYPKDGKPYLVVAQKLIAVAGNDNFLRAYAKTDGRELWKLQMNGGIAAAPVVSSDGTIYVSDGQNNLQAVGSDGTLKWTKKIGE